MSRYRLTYRILLLLLFTSLAACGSGSGSGSGGSAGGSSTGTTYDVGGTVSGLAGNGLLLRNNGSSLSVYANGTFSYSGAADGSSYAVTVAVQPSSPNQTCAVQNGTGTVAAANVTNIDVTCTTDSYTIGGTVSGLSGSGLTLTDNGGDTITINADGGFTFPTAVSNGGGYAVAVATQPASPTQQCSVSSGSGTVAGANVSNIQIACASNHTVGGTITGLTGTTTALVLQDNGGDDLSLTADGSFTFATAIADGSAYDVTIVDGSGAPDRGCTVHNGSGTMGTASVTDITISCVTHSYAVVDTNQTLCYDSASGAATACNGTGYDADYSGNPPGYTLSADGKVVKDNVTGLVWTQSTDTNGDGTVNYSDKMYQSDAAGYCSSLSLDGYQWRLPTIKEAYSLILFSGTDASSYTGSDTSVLTPFISSVFDWAFGDTSAGDRIIDGQYATATLYVSTTMNGNATMFGMNYVDGRIKGYPMDLKEFYVRCVAGNDSYGSNDFVDNGDGTVSDKATGLMWQQNDSGPVNFDTAISTCEAATTGGHSDWRLPNAKELQSIVDYSRSPDTTSSAAIDPVFTATSFTNEDGQTDWGYYWASTTHVKYGGSGTEGVYVAFGRALGYFDAGTGYQQVLDVHGAGAQRSDDKLSPTDVTGYGTANVGYGTFYYHGPQGDILRSNNWVRCVRDDN